jgi:flagellar motility protein MotE (MotC chaperone)
LHSDKPDNFSGREFYMNLNLNLTKREIIILAGITLISFPVIFVAVLFSTGNLRVEFGPRKKAPVEVNKPEVNKVETVKPSSSKADSLSVLNSKTYQALQQEREGIEKVKLDLQKERQSLELFQHDLETQKDSLKKERQRIDGLISKSDVIDKKKLSQLAKVYSAMRPAEAAQIIGTLSNDLAARILDGIADDRQKAKIVAALPAEKATAITQLMGGPSKLRK